MVIVVPSKFTERTNISDLFLEYSENLKKKKILLKVTAVFQASLVTLLVKNPSADARVLRNTGSIPGSGRSPEGGHGNPLQYSCLENPMDKAAWWAAVHSVAKSWTQSDLTCTHAQFL